MLQLNSIAHLHKENHTAYCTLNLVRLIAVLRPSYGSTTQQIGLLNVFVPYAALSQNSELEFIYIEELSAKQQHVRKKIQFSGEFELVPARFLPYPSFSRSLPKHPSSPFFFLINSGIKGFVNVSLFKEKRPID